LTNSHGGLVTARSVYGSVSESGMAMQADATPAGSSGGNIGVLGGYDVSLSGVTLSARGDFNPVGGYGKGGTIVARAYSHNLSLLNSTVNVLPQGQGAPAANRGLITLTTCNSITAGGDTFPPIG